MAEILPSLARLVNDNSFLVSDLRALSTEIGEALDDLYGPAPVEQDPLGDELQQPGLLFTLERHQNEMRIALTEIRSRLKRLRKGIDEAGVKEKPKPPHQLRSIADAAAAQGLARG